jgi:hypothetical protein
MKGKLIKTNSEDYHMGNYFLNNTEGFAIGSTDYEWCRRVSKPQYKLSKQNCDEIFGVVDVEKLTFECMKNTINQETGSDIHRLSVGLGFKKGFNKAIELNKDKLFTLSDISYAIAFSGKMKPSQIVKNLLEQPTEIEVEIVIDKIPADLAPGGWDVFPKLDAEGCLILKKVL